jgi:3-dehydroquinate synthase
VEVKLALRAGAKHTGVVSPTAAIPVVSARHRYQVVVGEGLLPELGGLIRSHAPKIGEKLAVVTDTGTAPLFGPIAESSLKSAGFDVAVIEVPAGETSKSLSMVGNVCDQLLSHQLDRHSAIIALGGGVIGDLAGFVAAIFHRGIRLVHVPTTIVAQVDSSIGGKTGVNTEAGKNLLGAIHPPELVITDVSLLDWLPERDFYAGFGEIIKHGVIADRAMLEQLGKFDRGRDLAALVRRNVRIKAKIVVTDEFESSDRRALLNFGHTVGHAIEAAAGYGRLLHGEAVAMGVAVAADLSVAKSGLPEADRDLLVARLEKFQLPTRIPTDLSIKALMEALRRDKKFKSGAIRFVLTRALGSAYLAEDVTELDIAEAIDGRR